MWHGWQELIAQQETRGARLLLCRFKQGVHAFVSLDMCRNNHNNYVDVRAAGSGVAEEYDVLYGMRCVHLSSVLLIHVQVRSA